MPQNTFDGDLYVSGSIGCKTFICPPGAIGDAGIAQFGGVQASKVQQQFQPTYRQPYAAVAAADRAVIHVVNGGSGQLILFRAGISQACTGNATITAKLRIGGVDVLSADLVVTSALAAFSDIEAAGFLDDSLVAGDVLEVDITVNAGSGALGKGFFAQVVLREDPQ